MVYDAPRLRGPARLGAPGETPFYAGKRGGKPSAKQRDISLSLVAHARAGSRVLRLKGGDPSSSGAAARRRRRLVQHGVPIRIIRGHHRQGIGGLAYAGIPVTSPRHQPVRDLRPPATDQVRPRRAVSLDWQAISRASPVIVIYMGMKHIRPIAAARCAEAGRPASEPRGRRDHRPPWRASRCLRLTLGTVEADIETAGLDTPRDHLRGPRPRSCAQALDWQAMAAGLAPAQTTDAARPPPPPPKAPDDRPARPDPCSARQRIGQDHASPSACCAPCRARAYRWRGAKNPAPTYIDPAFHAAACGPSHPLNLDALGHAARAPAPPSPRARAC